MQPQLRLKIKASLSCRRRVRDPVFSSEIVSVGGAEQGNLFVPKHRTKIYAQTAVGRGLWEIGRVGLIPRFLFMPLAPPPPLLPAIRHDTVSLDADY